MVNQHSDCSSVSTESMTEIERVDFRAAILFALFPTTACVSIGTYLLGIYDPVRDDNLRADQTLPWLVSQVTLVVFSGAMWVFYSKNRRALSGHYGLLAVSVFAGQFLSLLLSHLAFDLLTRGV
jgi:hypothetical protein